MLWREGIREPELAQRIMRTVIDPSSTLRQDWATPPGFRRTVRKPIHEFFGVRPGYQGLGFATIRSDDTFDVDLAVPEARHMLNNGDIRLYMDWWSRNGHFNTRIAEMLPNRPGGYDFREVGLGVLIFVRMKEVILALMEVAGFPLPQGRAEDANLEYSVFQRDA